MDKLKRLVRKPSDSDGLIGKPSNQGGRPDDPDDSHASQAPLLPGSNTDNVNSLTGARDPDHGEPPV